MSVEVIKPRRKPRSEEPEARGVTPFAAGADDGRSQLTHGRSGGQPTRPPAPAQKQRRAQSRRRCGHPPDREAVRPRRDHAPRRPGAMQNVEAIPTGSVALDLALGVGGVPRGRITEIYGPESSGKTTLCYHVIANAQSPRRRRRLHRRRTRARPRLRQERAASTSTTSSSSSRTRASRRSRSPRRSSARAASMSSSSTRSPHSCRGPRSRARWGTASSACRLA